MKPVQKKRGRGDGIKRGAQPELGKIADASPARQERLLLLCLPRMSCPRGKKIRRMSLTGGWARVGGIRIVLGKWGLGFVFLLFCLFNFSMPEKKHSLCGFYCLLK